MTAYFFVLVAGLAAGCLSGIVGTGATIILLPILVVQFGPQQAVPVMAIAGLMSNAGKVAAWWREVDWRAFAAFSVAGVPAAALGARTLFHLPPTYVEIALGLFFVLMIPVRHKLRASDAHFGPWQLGLAGGVIGFLTGVVMSTGPLMLPAFAFYGLSKGALLATEALSSLAVQTSKVATFRELGALPASSILLGLIVGSSVMAGTFLGKAVVQRMSTEAFQRVLDAMLLCSGLSMLWAATR